ncbi:hypothetical protein HYDPIDRAFT_65682, partial [Hydnomerulius pinastri MD-312]
TQHHQCLFVLDLQVRHLDTKSLQAYGNWLSRCWTNCQSRKRQAISRLRSCGSSEETLQAEWAAQVAHQMRPAPRQSKKKGDEEIMKILELEKLVVARTQTVWTLELQFIANCIHDLENFQIARARLRALQGNIFLQVCMNALAVKTRIRDRLRQRKFELERIERAYRQTIGDQRLCSHAEASVKRREPTLLRLVTTYNRLCDKLLALIRQRRAMRGAIVPHYIPREGLFELDVDDDIWQDVGLADDEVDPPAWLANDRVRAGIRDLLERDRCEEEE